LLCIQSCSEMIMHEGGASNKENTFPKIEHSFKIRLDSVGRPVRAGHCISRVIRSPRTSQNQWLDRVLGWISSFYFNYF